MAAPLTDEAGSGRRWLVAIDRPFYPSVTQYDDEAAALAAYEELLGEHSEGGADDATVYMAEVIQALPIKTHH